VQAYKKILLDECYNQIDSRIAAVQEALNAVQSSANEETKSSAGDKYETGRAMAQLEAERYRVQLSELQKERGQLNQIDPAGMTSEIRRGSLVKTDHGIFFLAAGIGKVKIETISFTVVSIESPLGRALKGKRVEQSAMFNGKTYRIEMIW